jgi:hypothetical protein
MADDINDVSHTSTLAKFEEAVRKDERSLISPETATANNTDREIWREPDEGNGSYYADSIHVTEGGGIGINCGGHVIVKPLRDWHALAQGQQDRNETLCGLAAFFSESVHHVWDKDEIADCLTNMISADTSTLGNSK